jgi:hypothetical protein
MGSSSTNSSKRKPQSTNTGRTKGSERGPGGASDSEQGMAAGNQKQGSSRKPSPGRRSGG